MPYDLKITGLANKDELKHEGPKDHRLYKFTLSEAPDGFWVLLLQQAGRAFSEVTISGNAGSTELWASADASVSVKQVLADAKRAVAQANVDATASDEQFSRAAKEKASVAAVQQDTLAKELDELDFSEAPASGATSSPHSDLAAFDQQLEGSEQASSTTAEPVDDTRPPAGQPSGGSSSHE